MSITLATDSISLTPHPQLGPLALRPLRLPEDAPLLHQWVTQPYARYWGMQQATVAEVISTYRELLSRPGYQVFLGLVAEEPKFLVERYDPTHDVLADYYPVQPGDCGMHLLLGPPSPRVSGFSWAVFSAVVDHLLQQPEIERVVVEPDVHNEKIHRLNRRAGFQYQKEIALPHKTAWLAFCTRADFEGAMAAEAPTRHMTPAEAWAWANRWLVAKMLGEFSHELLLHPRAEEAQGHYRLAIPDGLGVYRFRAHRYQLDHWRVSPESVQKSGPQGREGLDALAFVLEYAEVLGIPQEFLGTYLEEITSTLRSAAHKVQHARISVAALARADFQTIEHAMLEGHPIFVANSGRIGFGEEDFAQYAPEANQSFRLVWIAVHRQQSRFTAVPGLDYAQLMVQELGPATLERYCAQLTAKGLNPEDYLYMPVHPWQWQHKVATHFAAEIHQQRIVYLGEGPHEHSAQQSIRSLYNQSAPHMHYTKLSLSILNMGFLRGLSPHYMASTPAITQWIGGLLEPDPYLQSCGFTMLGEVATMGYHHPHFTHLGRSHANNKMLAALWRESPHTKVPHNRQLMTMAALLHVDHAGKPLVGELIRQSGQDAKAWMRRYLHAYLSPLLHCFYQYELVFMPHGENLILVLKESTIEQVLMKDITEEILLFDQARELPEAVERVRVHTTDEMKLLYLYTDVFDGFFRFLASLLDAHQLCPEEEFWALVADTVRAYQAQHPELAERFARYNLFQPTVRRCCLNRLQLSNTKHMLNLADPMNSLKFEGVMENPLSRYEVQRTRK